MSFRRHPKKQAREGAKVSDRSCAFLSLGGRAITIGPAESLDMSANKIVFGAECPDGMAWSVSPLDDNVGLWGYGGGMGRLPRASSDGWTIEVRCFLTAAPSLSHVFGFHYSEPSFYGSVSPGARAGLLAYGGANSRNIYFWGESADLDSGVEWNIAGAPNHVIVTHAPGSSAVTFYIRIGTTTSIVSGSLSAALIDFTPVGIFTGSRHLSGSNPITGKLSKQAIYTECKTKEQALALLDNPWATLRGRRGTARSSTGGSGSNLAASGGSTATGTAQPGTNTAIQEIRSFAHIHCYTTGMHEIQQLLNTIRLSTRPRSRAQSCI